MQEQDFSATGIKKGSAGDGAEQDGNMNIREERRGERRKGRRRSGRKIGNLLLNQRNGKALIITPKESMLHSHHPSKGFLRADSRLRRRAGTW